MSDEAPAPRGGKVYLDTQYIHISWDADGPWVLVKWKAWANSAEYREAQEIVIRALRENHGSRNLIDSTDRKVFSEADQKWLLENWMPRAAAAGRRWTAIVLPKSALGRTIAENPGKHPQSNRLNVRPFPTLPDAAAWRPTGT